MLDYVKDIADHLASNSLLEIHWHYHGLHFRIATFLNEDGTGNKAVLIHTSDNDIDADIGGYQAYGTKFTKEAAAERALHHMLAKLSRVHRDLLLSKWHDIGVSECQR